MKILKSEVLKVDVSEIEALNSEVLEKFEVNSFFQGQLRKGLWKSASASVLIRVDTPRMQFVFSFVVL